MKLTVNQIQNLDSLLRTNKFSDKEWDNRGLIPSDKSLSLKMNALINKCLIDLIESQNNNLTIDDYVKILDAGLKKFKKLDYDTEEKEFIADKFHQIAIILEIDYNEKINIWLYGRLFNKLLKHSSRKNNQPLDNIKIQCTNCNDTLTKRILKTEVNIPYYWVIVKCDKCGEINLFPAQKEIKEASFDNCTWIKSYAKSEQDSLSMRKILSDLKKNK